jgi:hypothetical protein
MGRTQHVAVGVLARVQGCDSSPFSPPHTQPSSSSCYPLSHSINAIGPAPLRSGRILNIMMLHLHFPRSVNIFCFPHIPNCTTATTITHPLLKPKLTVSSPIRLATPPA